MLMNERDASPPLFLYEPLFRGREREEFDSIVYFAQIMNDL